VNGCSDLPAAPDVSLCVVTDAVRALDESRGQVFLNAWAARGVRLATTAEVIART
jgi:hypothetical protein